jgi:peptidoglycan hydrolase-like protein with peptidoglycan-binding domain
MKYGYADEQTQIRAASDDAVLHSEYIEKQMDAQLQLGGSGGICQESAKAADQAGYYAGKIDGKYRSSTEAAVRDFQTANGLPVTGKADGRTRAVLDPKTPNTVPVTRAQYEEANFLTPLKLGSKGAQVSQLQTRLAELGFYWGEPTGNFDAQTKYCVKFFQEANGFSVTGSASKTLRASSTEIPASL